MIRRVWRGIPREGGAVNLADIGTGDPRQSTSSKATRNALWQALEHNDWMAVPAAAASKALEVDIALPTNVTPGPFAFADPDRIRATLTAAASATLTSCRTTTRSNSLSPRLSRTQPAA